MKNNDNLTVTEAAARLSIPYSSLYWAILSGHVTGAVKLPGKGWKIPVKALDGMAEEMKFYPFRPSVKQLVKKYFDENR